MTRIYYFLADDNLEDEDKIGPVQPNEAENVGANNIRIPAPNIDGDNREYI